MSNIRGSKSLSVASMVAATAIVGTEVSIDGKAFYVMPGAAPVDGVSSLTLTLLPLRTAKVTL
jgi:hypothetical protein